MYNENIRKLFTLFSGENYSETHAPFIEVAVIEVESILFDSADKSDRRLEFLCAALANFRYRQALVSSDRSEYTYEGKLLSGADSKVLEFSENLLRSYYRLCRDLIKPSEFVFLGFDSEII